MYRKVYNDLLNWKNSNDRKPLLLLGARQVGKTWLMKEFGRREYKNVVYINCDSEPLTRELFLKDYDISRLLLGFQVISGKSISEGTTLIILDELQEAPRGLHSLKYFCENAPGYHIVAAGSLLGVTLAQQESFPVGQVDMLKMYPMDFEEFLLALDQKPLCDLIAARQWNLLSTFNEQLTWMLRQYYFIGGMPEVVSSFVQSNDLNKVRALQEAIVSAYRMDISKHTSKADSVRIGMVLSSLPSQLAKENKKFIYGAVKSGGRAAEFELAIQWLVDAGLVYKVNRVSRIAAPLKFYENFDAFKLFFLDIGLLCCMGGISSEAILFNSDGLTEFKGMEAEEYVAQQLVAQGYSLYYWSNDRTPAEIDFVIPFSSGALPIEVKASTNVRGRSLTMYLKENPEAEGLRVSLKGYIKQERLTNLPLWALPFGLVQ